MKKAKNEKLLLLKSKRKLKSKKKLKMMRRKMNLVRLLTWMKRKKKRLKKRTLKWSKKAQRLNISMRMRIDRDFIYSF